MNLDSIVSGIRIDTAWGPPIVLNHPFAPSTGQPPSKAMSILKPKITIISPLRASPVVFDPWGDPGVSKWPQLKWGLLVGGAALLGLALGGLVRVLR